jgi:predicted alpha/beta superfamily hydrolase
MLPRVAFHPYFAPTVVGDALRWPAVTSAHIEHARDVLIWLPPGYREDRSRRYPVLYLHDGQNKIDAATSFAGTEWDVDRAATELILRGAIEPMIMVAIYNSPDRLHEYNPLDRGYAYSCFIMTEIMPVIDAEFRTEGGRRNAVMGSSMGGLISMAMLVWNPTHFFAAAALSPSLWALRRAGGPEAWIKRHDPPSLPVKLYLDHGTKGAEARVAPLAKEVKDCFLAAGLPSAAIKYTVARGGEHNEKSWGVRVDKPLKFLFGQKPKRAPRKRAAP